MSLLPANSSISPFSYMSHPSLCWGLQSPSSPEKRRNEPAWRGKCPAKQARFLIRKGGGVPFQVAELTFASGEN